jgi:hypothetical protein
MTRLFVFALTVTVLGAAAGCYAEPLSRGPSNNPEVAIELLFSHDGCDVYRFVDHGAHYFARCRDAKAVSTVSTKTCGKAPCDEEISATTAERVRH